MSIQEELNSMHGHLMYLKFPYHSVSVIHRHQDLGFHVFFSDSVRDMVTDSLKGYLKSFGFGWSFTKSTT